MWILLDAALLVVLLRSNGNFVLVAGTRELEDCQSIRAGYLRFPLFLIRTVGFYLYLFKMD